MRSPVRRAARSALGAVLPLALLGACHGASADDAPADVVAARDAHWGTTLELPVTNAADPDTTLLFPDPRRVVGAVPVTLHELVTVGADTSAARPLRVRFERHELGADTSGAGGFCAPVLRDRRTGVVFVLTRYFVEGHTTRHTETVAPNETRRTQQQTRMGWADYVPLTPAPVRIAPGAWVRVSCGGETKRVLGLAPSPRPIG